MADKLNPLLVPPALCALFAAGLAWEHALFGAQELNLPAALLQALALFPVLRANPGQNLALAVAALGAGAFLVVPELLVAALVGVAAGCRAHDRVGRALAVSTLIPVSIALLAGAPAWDCHAPSPELSVVMLSTTANTLRARSAMESLDAERFRARVLVEAPFNASLTLGQKRDAYAARWASTVANATIPADSWLVIVEDDIRVRPGAARMLRRALACSADKDLLWGATVNALDYRLAGLLSTHMVLAAVRGAGADKVVWEASRAARAGLHSVDLKLAEACNLRRLSCGFAPVAKQSGAASTIS